ncbi:hypothetical protein KUTeg_005466 [Tegillarca granosa]|uniref:Uncharacterized protein n=1 Tax=Tegillarca granosa TaxID=220873 RepID=A0ABQ9FNP5_TEGGR|nr:hypothetical protein KUTeg_005466 [Tegillarca granosa]
MMFFYPTFTVTHPDTAKILLKSSEPKSKSTAGIHKMFLPWLGDGLLISNGPKWERNRRLLTPAFHFDILMPYIAVYNKVADIFLGKLLSLSSLGSVEICNPVSQATLDTMLRCALSYEGRIQEKGDDHPYVKAVKELCHRTIQRALKPWFFVDFLFFLSPEGRQYKQLCDYVHDFADNIITTRKAVLAKDPDQLKKRRLDFLDILLTAKDEHGKGLSELDIRAEVDTFLFEGHDTTASALSWAIYCLAKYPDEQRKVYDEAKSILNDKKDEVMRYYTTVPILNRTLTKDTELDGVIIPKNSTVDIGIHLLNHHPDVWTDPDNFKPERLMYTDEEIDPFRYVPFSAGPRNCIGQNFAMNEMKVMIAKLVNRFSITLDEKHQVVPVPEVVMRAKYGIKVFLNPR